jgi:hypothetical protein
MQNPNAQSAPGANGTIPVRRGFWSRFWESLRSSLGSACF